MRMSLPVLQPVTPNPVRTLMVYLTEDCNLRCSYCFVAKKKRSMSAEVARKTVDFFLGPQVSGSERDLQINFFGGEPLLEVDRMEEILRRTSEQAARSGRRVDFSVTTNGTLFSERIAALIREFEMAVLYSLDGGPSITGEDRPFLSGRSSHDLVVSNLPRFLEASQGRLMLRTTFHPTALRLVERVEYLLSLGAPSISLCPVVDSNWEGFEAAIDREYDRLADWFLERCRAGELPPLELTWLLVRQWEWAHLGGQRPARPCPVGHSLMAVDPDGNVLPCHRFLYRRQDWLGTLDQPELDGRQRFVELHSSQMAPDCDNCPARPVCGGGCRLVALQRGLELTATYSGYCIPMRAHARAAYRIYRELAQSRLLERVLGFESPVGSDNQKIFAGEVNI